jgi:hypothetical protein
VGNVWKCSVGANGVGDVWCVAACSTTVMTAVCVCAELMCVASVQPTCMQHTTMQDMNPGDMRASIKHTLYVHAA